ncbi:TonB family protein [Marivirga lumbricoides]
MKAYVAGSLSAEEQHQVEKFLLDNPFEAEAMEGYLEQTSSLNDLALLNKRLKERIEKTEEDLKIVPIWRKVLPYAAVFSLLIMATIIGTVLISQQEEIKPISLQNNDRLLDEDESLKPPAPTIAEAKEEIKEEEPLVSNNDTTNEKNKVAEQDKPEMETLATKEPENSLLAQDAPKELILKENISEQLQGKVAGVATDKETRNEDEIISPDQPVPAEIITSSLKARSKKAISDGTIVIKGKVLDAETGEGLPGVNIFVKNKSIGVNSDLEGNFEITAGPEDILVATFIGMEKEEIAVGGKSEIEIELYSDVAQLSEVVVTGYSTQKQTDDTYQAASPVGGFSSFNDYIEENLQYPKEAKENKMEGKVVLKVFISSTGSIKNIEVTKSLGEEFDKEAIRLIEEGPKWLPAKRGEQSVESTKRIRIKFKL